MASGEVALGPVARYLGILAATTSRWEDAARHFEDALALSARIGARPLLAHPRTTTRACCWHVTSPAT